MAEIRGERIKAIATEGHKSTRKETLVWLPFFVAFRDFLWPFPSCPSRAQGSMLSSRESPRSGVNVVGLRPSLIAQHSLRSPSCALFTSARREGGFSVINDGRSPGKTPSIRGDSRERKSRATKNTKMHEKLLWRGIPYCGFSCPFVAITPPGRTPGIAHPRFPNPDFRLTMFPYFANLASFHPDVLVVGLRPDLW